MTLVVYGTFRRSFIKDLQWEIHKKLKKKPIDIQTKMFNLHPSFGFSTKDSYTTTTYREEIRIKRKDLPPEAIHNSLRYNETVIFKVYISHKSGPGFDSNHYQTYLTNFYKNLLLFEKVPKIRIYVFRMIMRDAIKVFPAMSVWWRHHFINHYIAAIEILKVLGNDKPSLDTRKVVDEFMSLSEAFLLENPDIVFEFPLQYFTFFTEKFPEETLSFALKRSRYGWVRKEMAQIIRDTNPMRIREISTIFKNIPFAICKLICEYEYIEFGETFLEYFNKNYDYVENKMRPDSKIKDIKRNMVFPVASADPILFIACSDVFTIQF